jgi:AcrR family transcriptional regulator
MSASAHRQSKRPRLKPQTAQLPAAAAERPNLLIGEKLPPMPAQSRSRDKRDALLRAALELFGHDGFEATAIGAIAQRAGTAVGAFYQHFRSKRQLLLVLMNDLLQKLERVDMRPEADTLRDAIESVLRAGLTTDLAYAGAYRAWREARLSDRRLAALDEQIRAWTTNRLRNAFTALHQLPGARRDVDAALFAALMDRLFWDLLGTNMLTDSRLIGAITEIIVYTLFEDAASV